MFPWKQQINTRIVADRKGIHYYLETILQNTREIRTMGRRILKNSVEYQERSRMRKQAIEQLR